MRSIDGQNFDIMDWEFSIIYTSVTIVFLIEMKFSIPAKFVQFLYVAYIVLLAYGIYFVYRSILLSEYTLLTKILSSLLLLIFIPILILIKSAYHSDYKKHSK